MDSPDITIPIRNILLRIAYDGTDFFGWQIQPQRPTVQGTIAAAIEKITGEAVSLCGSGRTDAGVHAVAQAANVRFCSPIPCPNLLRALNRLLPESIRILSAEPVPETFHARHDAASKIYLYRIYRPPICPPSLARFVTPYPYPLDEEAMAQAAGYFQGTLDFRSFASADGEEGSLDKSCVRTIFRSSLVRQGEELQYTVEGSGFLHHMVRNIVGTLLDVGRGRTSASAVPRIIAACKRTAAGPTSPARGLHLLSVAYPPEKLGVIPAAAPSGPPSGQ
jgi:tRNA pseudouridine38-40 synthase